MRTPNRFAWSPAAALLIGCVAASLPTRSEAAGEIYWFSLLSEDAAAASTFYADLFGWEIQPSPTGALLALRDGVPIAGINQIENRLPEASESTWLAAIRVGDLPQSVATARELGATIHEDVRRLEGWGSYALLQDPEGAPIMLVVPERRLGGNLGYSGWRWAELWTHDPDRAADFYTRVIGYERDEVQVRDEPYSAFRSEGKPQAGLVKLEQPEVAPRWAPYVGVSDLRAILVRVWQLRGKVLREPAELDFAVAGANRVDLIADPTGGAMFLYQLEEQATADPAVAAQAAANSSRSQTGSGGGRDRGSSVDISVSVSVGYGFGPGWGSAYPAFPNGRPYGIPY